MTTLKGACLIGQSGGPTSVINSSVLGCVEAALKSEYITKVFGAAHGIKGILNDYLYDLTLEDPEELKLLKHTPSAALGSCRYKLADPDIDDTDYKRFLEILKKYGIRYFFYIGGNDSMDTCNKLGRFLSDNDYECRVIGIPKTIDNDLAITDHCPGYGSAAKYVATTFMEVYRDATVYDSGSITVIEVMGRNAGWLTAASALAKYNGAGPDLIYLPEVAFDLEKFVTDVERVYKEKGYVIVAVSEGVKDKEGKYISSYFTDMANKKDAFGHAQMGGLAAGLANYANKKIHAKIRGIELSLLQRCAAHLASKTDIEEAYMAGKAALEAAVDGQTAKMVAFKREEGEEYICKTILVDLSEVANVEKTIPREWINKEGNDVLKAFINYALPLVQGETEMKYENGLPRFARLKKIKAKA
jgi:6-phosphofructokinase